MVTFEAPGSIQGAGMIKTGVNHVFCKKMIQKSHSFSVAIMKKIMPVEMMKYKLHAGGKSERWFCIFYKQI